MLHAGLDLSRKRLDVCLIDEAGEVVGRLAAPPDADGLRGLVGRIAPCGEPVRGVIESMTGARFVHDTLERLGWEVLIADAQKVKGLAPLACKTDKIDAQVLAVLSHRDLVPAIWLPDPRVRREREQARFRLHLVKHKSSLKCRIHSTMITFGHPCPVTDLFGVAGRELLDRLQVPQPWRGTIDASLELIDDLERRIAEINRELKAGGAGLVDLALGEPDSSPVSLSDGRLVSAAQLIRRFHDTTAGTALVQTGRREPSPISALNCRCRRAVEASGRWSLPYAAPAWRGGQPALGVA